MAAKAGRFTPFTYCPKQKQVKEKIYMRDVLRSFAIALCLFLTAGSVIFACGQNSNGILPPHPSRVKTPAVHLGNSRTVSAQSTTAPFWTKLNNPPPVSIGAMLLLTDGRVLAHEERNCGGANGTGRVF